ncbi:MAG: glutamine--fructose-6-phosphate transaminase (isomerizing), partial [Coxiellaceae bacterium]|nr:glutamine--fructose-6-phosphate transaminase (isomerizing) [Coxiellaceae bacterium]
MCGIVGAIAHRDVAPILVEGLKRLEYRGYDSAGLAIMSSQQDQIVRIRTEGKVQQLADSVKHSTANGMLGIAHTRWATHGKPSESNAHPHLSFDDLALVHNGIIENHDELRQALISNGYTFSSETDTEVAVHTIHKHLQGDGKLLQAVYKASGELAGAFAFGIIRKQDPNTLIAVRRGSPLVIGIGQHEHFIASDVIALLPVTQQFIYLEDDDIAEITCDGVTIYNKSFQKVERAIHTINHTQDSVSRGKYRHFMLKEIFEQPRAVCDTLEARVPHDHVLPQAFGVNADAIFASIKRVQIVACGTSYHAGLVGKYWLESLAKIPTRVEIASEFRYRDGVIEPDTLFVAISQSGETADTLAALKKAKDNHFSATLAICNVAESTLVRESDLTFLTRAGIE